jgi:hypothetical protein
MINRHLLYQYKYKDYYRDDTRVKNEKHLLLTILNTVRKNEIIIERKSKNKDIKGEIVIVMVNKD